LAGREPLNRSNANADGDPAEDGIEFLSEVGRCNEGGLKVSTDSPFEGVDLESKSQ
jgi:hypothetical protein